jgi:CheY-like chemotaxis protein
MDVIVDKVLLIVEDSPEDLEATMRALRTAGRDPLIAHCADGDEALDYLHRRGRFLDPAAAPRPSLVLLDLNLPGTDGREVLCEIRSTPALRTIPVVVFTTSADPHDIEACERLGASAYVQKPIRADELTATLRRLLERFLDPPTQPHPAAGATS